MKPISLSSVSLVLANLFPIYGIFHLGWDLKTIFCPSLGRRGQAPAASKKKTFCHGKEAALFKVSDINYLVIRRFDKGIVFHQ